MINFILNHVNDENEFVLFEIVKGLYFYDINNFIVVDEVLNYFKIRKDVVCRKKKHIKVDQNLYNILTTCEELTYNCNETEYECNVLISIYSKYVLLWNIKYIISNYSSFKTIYCLFDILDKVQNKSYLKSNIMFCFNIECADELIYYILKNAKNKTHFKNFNEILNCIESIDSIIATNGKKSVTITNLIEKKQQIEDILFNYNHATLNSILLILFGYKELATKKTQYITLSLIAKNHEESSFNKQ